jgi:hypothetical protein
MQKAKVLIVAPAIYDVEEALGHMYTRADRPEEIEVVDVIGPENVLRTLSLKPWIDFIYNICPGEGVEVEIMNQLAALGRLERVRCISYSEPKTSDSAPPEVIDYDDIPLALIKRAKRN